VENDTGRYNIFRVDFTEPPANDEKNFTIFMSSKNLSVAIKVSETAWHLLGIFFRWGIFRQIFFQYESTPSGATGRYTLRNFSCRDQEMITELEWTPAGVCILCWSRSRSQHFRFEPESTWRSVQEPSKNFWDLISVVMLVVVKQIGINWDVFSDHGRHRLQKCDTGWEYRPFHH